MSPSTDQRRRAAQRMSVANIVLAAAAGSAMSVWYFAHCSAQEQR